MGSRLEYLGWIFRPELSFEVASTTNERDPVGPGDEEPRESKLLNRKAANVIVSFLTESFLLVSRFKRRVTFLKDQLFYLKICLNLFYKFF